MEETNCAPSPVQKARSIWTSAAKTSWPSRDRWGAFCGLGMAKKLAAHRSKHPTKDAISALRISQRRNTRWTNAAAVEPDFAREIAAGALWTQFASSNALNPEIVLTTP